MMLRYYFYKVAFALMILLNPLSADAEEPQSAVADFAELIQEQCVRCHNPNKAKGGFGYVADLSQLKSSDYVDPQNLTNSMLYTLVLNGEMPPSRDGERNDADAELVLKWLRAGMPVALPPAAAAVSTNAIPRGSEASATPVSSDANGVNQAASAAPSSPASLQ